MSPSNPFRFLAALLSSSYLFSTTNAAYTLQDSYTPSNFFSQFDFFTDADPTNGYVDYQSQSAAQSANLISTSNNQVYMGVDYTSIGSGRGRKSVRITSKAVYNHGLILLDLEHMPGNICGAWPAFWTVGPNWPNNGEIDIIEGVNGQVGNSVALHTGPGCSVGGGSSSGSSGNTSPNTGSAQAIFSGTVKTSNCDVAAANQATNAGCAITSSNSATYGDGLNSVNGGVYATEWTSSAISVWFFPRSSIPSDITSGNPNPNSWGSPIASFGGGSCTIDNSFKNQQIVFDTTFCGDWAGSVWSTDSTCSSKASTCQEYVMNNPSAFKNAYWTINSLMVYTGGSSGSPGVSASASASVSASASGGVSMSTSGIVSVPTPSVSGIPVPPFNSNSNSGFGSGFPTKSTSSSSALSMSATYTNTYSNSYSNSYTLPTASSAATPIATTSLGGNPYNPAPTPLPTTMSTSSRGWSNPNWSQSGYNSDANTWTWSWGGNNNNNNDGGWPRGGGGNWGNPPRVMAKYAQMSPHGYGRPGVGGEDADAGGAGIAPDGFVRPSGSPNTTPSMPEQAQPTFNPSMLPDMDGPQRDGATAPTGGNTALRTLVPPMIRRAVDTEQNNDSDSHARYAGHIRRHQRRQGQRHGMGAS